MKYIKRFILDFLVLILTAALLAGCKKGNTGSNTVPLPVQKGESKKEPAAGGTLRIPMNASPESPAFCASGTNTESAFNGV